MNARLLTFLFAIMVLLSGTLINAEELSPEELSRLERLVQASTGLSVEEEQELEELHFRFEQFGASQNPSTQGEIIENEPLGSSSRAESNRPWTWEMGTLGTLLLIALIGLLFFTERYWGTVIALGLSSILFVGIVRLLEEFAREGFKWVRLLNLGSGYLAFFLLAASLMIGPLTRLYRHKTLFWFLKQRRNIGVLVFIFSFIHLVFVLHSFYDGSFITWLNYYIDGGLVELFNREYPSFSSIFLNHHTSMILGFVAFILLGILAFISNKPARRILGGRAWRNIQRSAYLIFILSAVHIIGFGLVFMWWPSFETFFNWTIIGVIVLQIAGIFATMLRNRSLRRKTASPLN